MGTFHPEHDGWHGFTVLVFFRDGGAAVGRWDRDEGGTVAIWDACSSAADATEGFLARLRTHGPRVEVPRLTFPAERIASVRRLGDWLRGEAN
jgi:hypothetical protein